MKKSLLLFLLFNILFYIVPAYLAQENHIAFIPLFLSGIDDKPSLMQADGLHPTAEAQPIILENIWPALKMLLS